MRSDLRAIVTGALLGAVMLFALGPAPQAAAPGQGKGKGKPGVEFDENKSPLQKGMEQAVDEKKALEQLKPQCQSALDSGDAERIDKFCDFPKLTMRKLDASECSSCGDIVDPSGKLVGKRIKTKTTIDYSRPGQRGIGMTRWDDVMVQKRAIGEIGNGTIADDRQTGAERSKLRRAVLFPHTAVNEDRDCLDRVTGQRQGGYVDPALPASPANLIADGEPASCFDSGHLLKRTLVEAPGGCVHVSGRVLEGDPLDGVEDECYDEAGALRTSLEEMIDEDGPEQIDDDNDGQLDEDPDGDLDGDGNSNDDGDCMTSSGVVQRGADCFDAQGAILDGLAELVDEDGPDLVDQDADGRVNEDAPAASHDDACRDFGASRGLRAGLGDVSGDECGLNRAVIAGVNDQFMRQHGVKMYLADDDGRFDPNAPGLVEFGQERRKVVLTETFTITCEDGLSLVDGQCVSGPPTLAGRLSPGDGQADMLSAGAVPSPPSFNGKVTEQVMMGFTVAPPVLKWGPTIEEYACVDLPFLGETCVEIFFARVGYEFDMAVGLRLPMEVSVSEIPQPTTLAGREVTLQSMIQPLDFTAKQYKDFCVKHRLADEPFISDCDRFSFPTFLDALNPGITADTIDGDEFVARLVVFAGVIVRVVGAPVISWGIDTATDLPTLCTFLQIKDNNFNLLNFGADLAQDKGILGALKNQLANCSSFTTPFGLETDPTNPLLKRLRAFPLGRSFDVRADCAEALVRKESVTIKKKTRPICTGLVLGANGASLGIGLGLEVSAGSRRVESAWSASEDAVAASGLAVNPIAYEHSADEGEPPIDVGVIEIDNFDPTVPHDTARVTMQDFTFLLNTIQLKLRARLQFGGILSPIPDLAALTLYNFIFDLGDTGIPIGQHAGTENIEIPILVENHALEVDARPDPIDSGQLSDLDTLIIRPGEAGNFKVAVRNTGSVFGDFDNFRVELSNRPDQSPPFSFGINLNTDFDCEDFSQTHYRGNPHDSVADDCFGVDGQIRSDRAELIDEDPAGPAGAPPSVRDQDGDGLVDEDPADAWTALPAAADLAQKRIDTVPPYTLSSDVPGLPVRSVSFSVSPFRHPLTAPGVYPVRVTADSLDARVLGMSPQDASGQLRLGAGDVTFVRVASFFDAQVDVQPEEPAGPPGEERLYEVAGTNFGNAADSMRVQVEFVDFNQARCGLATLGTMPAGSSPDCPYRAFPTAIQAGQAGVDWTTVSGLAERLGPLDPLEVASTGFAVRVPDDWAGMRDSTYQFIVTVSSTGDAAVPAASDRMVVEQTVLATPQSRARYIGLEIDELIAEIEAIAAAGIGTGGLSAILRHPVKTNNDLALEMILSGDPGGAAQLHSRNVRMLQGFLLALEGFGGGGTPPEDFVTDWTLRSEAILADLMAAAGIPAIAPASTVESGAAAVTTLGPSPMP